MGYKSEYKHQWYLKNKEKILERTKKWYEETKEIRLAQRKEYYNTKLGRARALLRNYNEKDKEAGRGVGNLTPEWIVENIFNGQKCAHCEEDDWTKLGCNRIDNDLPHTTDNVEPCCKEHNDKLAAIEHQKKVYQYDKNGNLIKIYDKIIDVIKDGFSDSHVSQCCNNKRKTHKGFIWKSTLISN